VTGALLIAAVSLFGCALQTFTPVQPTFRTMDISAAYQRAVQAVAEHCGPVAADNPEAKVVMGAWTAWHSPDGLTLTRCIVSVAPDDQDSGSVRITFAPRLCPPSDVSDLDALAPTCERVDTVRQLVNAALDETARKLEAAIRR
jgi:hypothetical protein